MPLETEQIEVLAGLNMDPADIVVHGAGIPC